jgi:hypothetical protein
MLRIWCSGRALAEDAQGPGFHFQHCQKKKNTQNKKKKTQNNNKKLGMVVSRE